MKNKDQKESRKNLNDEVKNTMKKYKPLLYYSEIMRTEKRLTPHTELVFSIIYRHCIGFNKNIAQNQQWFGFSNEWISRNFYMNAKTVSRAVKELIAKEFIVVENHGSRSRKEEDSRKINVHPRLISAPRNEGYFPYFFELFNEEGKEVKVTSGIIFGMIYREIVSFEKEAQAFIKTNVEIAQKCRVSLSTVSRALCELETKKYITISNWRSDARNVEEQRRIRIHRRILVSLRNENYAQWNDQDTLIDDFAFGIKM